MSAAGITNNSAEICTFDTPNEAACKSTSTSASGPSSKFLLTPRELEVLKLICEGLDYAQIGARLNIAEKTVGTHRANIAEKTGTHTSVAMLRWALRRGLITTADLERA